MTLMTQSNKTVYTCDGVTVAFSTVWPFQLNTDVFVSTVLIADGTKTPMVEGVDYTLTGGGTGGAGVVTTNGIGAPLPAIYQLEILRVLPLTQLINLVSHDQFDAETVERGFDQGIMIDQQLDARITAIEFGGGVGGLVDGVNVGGSGVGVFAGKVANALAFWKLKAGAGISIALDSDGISIESVNASLAPPGGALKFLRSDGVWSNTLGDPALPAFNTLELAAAGGANHIQFTDPTLVADGKKWAVGTAANSFVIRTLDDAGASVDDAFLLHRIGANTDSLHLMSGSGGKVVIGQPDTEDNTALQVGGGARIEGSLFLDKFNGGAVISGDMSNADVSKRLSFQTSELNNSTFFTTKPNGTNRLSGIFCHDKSDLSQPGSFIGLYNDGTQTMIRNSTINGGPALPFRIFHVSQYPFTADLFGNVTCGGDAITPADLPTSTTTRHFYIPTMNGAPTGVPTAKTGFVPIVYDRAANQICIYNAGAWKKTAVLT